MNNSKLKALTVGIQSSSSTSNQKIYKIASYAGTVLSYTVQ